MRIGSRRPLGVESPCVTASFRSILILLTSLVLLLASFILFWMKPQAPGISALGAWASFQGGSIFGIKLWSIAWLVGTSAVVVTGFFRLVRQPLASPGEEVVRGLKWCLTGAASAALLSVLPMVQVDFALSHLAPHEHWSSDWGPFGTLMVSGLLAGSGALVLLCAGRVLARGSLRRKNPRG